MKSMKNNETSIRLVLLFTALGLFLSGCMTTTELQLKGIELSRKKQLEAMRKNGEQGKKAFQDLRNNTRLQSRITGTWYSVNDATIDVYSFSHDGNYVLSQYYFFPGMGGDVQALTDFYSGAVDLEFVTRYGNNLDYLKNFYGPMIIYNYGEYKVMMGAIVLLSQVIDDIVVLQQYAYRLNDEDTNILMLDYGKGSGFVQFDRIGDDYKDKTFVDEFLAAEAGRNPTTKAFLRWDKGLEVIDEIDPGKFWLARGLWVTAVDDTPVTADTFYTLVDEGTHTLTIMVKLRDDRNGTEYDATVSREVYFTRGKSYRVMIEMDTLNRMLLEDINRDQSVKVSFSTLIVEY
jgi:hypothetical protein